MSPLDVITEKELQQSLDRVMDEVAASNAHVVVTREDKKPVVVMSYDEFRSLEETLHLLSSRRNAGHLIEAIGELEAGKGVERPLLDPDKDPTASDAA